MPTYDYECTKGHRWQAFLSILDFRDQKCAECGEVGKREIGAGVGIMMKNRGPVSESIMDRFNSGKTKVELQSQEADVDRRARNLGHEVP